MADIVHRIPFEISSFGGSGVGGSYGLQNYAYDYAVGGIPFLSATRDQWPYTEGMAPIRKDQFDNSAEPGEQSLQGWWLRSQSSFASGAGVLYQDPDTQNPYVRAFDLRFADSLGVDSWTAGSLQLLRQMDNRVALTSSFNRASGYVDPSGADAAFYMDGGNLFKVTPSALTPITLGSIGTPLDLASFGTRYFALMTDGIWSGIDTAAAVKMYSPPAGTIITGTIAFAKDRIVAAFNNGIYFAPIATAGLPVTLNPPGAGIPFYVHTDPNWRWVSISEGPSAIYAAGTNGTTSSIFRFVVDTQPATPTMTQTVTATMPTGEVINTIYGYVGSFLGIASNRGFRVGELDQGGDVSYGPLLFSPASGCQSITGFDRFMWVGSKGAHDGFSGLFRVDLGQGIQEQSTQALRYAYARDVYAPTDTAAAIGVTRLGASNRLIFMTQQDTLYIQSATVLYPEGYLKTGRIRFNTEEPKLYKFVSLRAPTPLQGEIQFSLLDQTGATIPYITYSPTFSPSSGDVGTPQPPGPQNWIALQFTLRRGASDTTVGGVLNGWQVKALPGSIRQRIIQHTFLLLDEESDRAGQRQGYDGWTRQRLENFKALARAGDVVTFQELAEDISSLVVIDDWKYTQLGPPGPNGGALGGYLTVTMRTVAEST